jgi:cation transport ATPase
LESIVPGDELVVFPHEICPVDGTVVEGHGAMDESYLTGEPYVMSKAPGSEVLSGAVNGETALTVRAIRLAKDSRYAESWRPRRTERAGRLSGARAAWRYYAIAVVVAVAAYLFGSATRAVGARRRHAVPLILAIPSP